MTRSDLLDLVYRFYPRGLYVDSLGYDDTEEAQRQRDAARRAVAGYPTWNALLDRLRPRYELWNRSEYTQVSTYRGDDPAYWGEIYIPGRRIGFHVSLLGPYYGIRRTGVPGEEAAALDLAREIEAIYPEYEPIPPELGDEVVPDVALDGRIFGKATIYHCLLSQEWEGCSGEWDNSPREWEDSGEPWPPPESPPPSHADRTVLDRGPDSEPGPTRSGPTRAT